MGDGTHLEGKNFCVFDLFDHKHKAIHGDKLTLEIFTPDNDHLLD